MRFAYADPPYLGQCLRYGHRHDDGCWNRPATHLALLGRLVEEFPDGWALSCSSPSLRLLLPAAPPDVRVGAWVKPYFVFKPGVEPAYGWEPVIFRGGRKHPRGEQTTWPDWHMEGARIGSPILGGKPPGFCSWVLRLLGYEDGDELVDVFPGTGVMGLVAAQGVLL